MLKLRRLVVDSTDDELVFDGVGCSLAAVRRPRLLADGDRAVDDDRWEGVAAAFPAGERPRGMTTQVQ